MWRAAKASAYIRAPVEVVYSVLTSYDLYRSWVPDIIESRLLAREGDVAIAEFICPRYGRDKFVLELIESPPSAISYSRIDHHRIKLTGGWLLEPTHGGERVVVHADLRLDGRPHQLLLRRAMGEVLARTVAALTERSTQIEAALETGEVPPGDVILDLRCDEDGVVVRLGSQTFELHRTPQAEEK